MDDARLQSVLSKIQQLRALAGSTHSPAEAESALRLAARLQAQHRLESAEVEARSGKTSEIDVDTPVYIYQTGKISYWRNNHAHIVASLSGVFLAIDSTNEGNNGRKFTRYRLVGKKPNVEMAVQMFNYLLELVPRLAAEKIPPRNMKGINPAKEAFCNGCVQGYAVKMQTERDSIIREGSSVAISILGNESEGAERAFRKSMDDVFNQNTFKSKAKRVPSAEYAGYSKRQSLSIETKKPEQLQ